jgi:phosphatidylglycerol:prolipoprotein diacylglycerol transferase
MWPKIGPYPLYAFIYYAGTLAQFVLCYLIARKLRLRWPIWVAVGICYSLGMFVGAKILYDVFRGHFSLGALFTWQHWMDGGMWGGPLAFLALAVPVVLLLAPDRRAGLDLVALSLPIPLIIAKLACLSHGCCHGRPTNLPWAITFPEGGATPAGVPLHPTQVYEILVLLVALVVLSRLDRRRWRGTLLLWFLAVYGPGRALAELFRADLQQRVLVGGLSLSEVLCAGVGLLSILILIYRRRRFSSTLEPAERDVQSG